MVNDEELIQGFQRCRELGALPQVWGIVWGQVWKVCT